MSRDLAILVAAETAAGDVERVIRKNAGPWFKEVTLFDVYTGAPVAEGKKSLAFALQFQSNDKTLTDEEVDASFQKIVESVAEAFGAELRA